ncbi:unnamed protein product [Eruca vesicaria subsp. sativa]|uniref:Uncharacterized protein n=1 Tax=Eruca vesicaria subsp. sativa TaxID=29727 RepID=A0ABC8L7W5_ERUVS|nr:unnamed protein product [Eruca vesicaria subsp. sativa]
MQTSFSEPRLLIHWSTTTSPSKRCFGKHPIIAFCHTDYLMRFVDIGIPANKKGKHSFGCLFLASCSHGPSYPWNHSSCTEVGCHAKTVWLTLYIAVLVHVDMFFYREPEEAKPEDEEEVAPLLLSMEVETTAAIPDAAWPGEAQAPISAAPVAGSWNDSSVAPAAEGGGDPAVPPQ